jgi:hypothetical protein
MAMDGNGGTQWLVIHHYCVEGTHTSSREVQTQGRKRRGSGALALEDIHEGTATLMIGRHTRVMKKTELGARMGRGAQTGTACHAQTREPPWLQTSTDAIASAMVLRMTW